MKRVRESVSSWWNGRYVPYENGPSDSVIIIGGHREWHWTAKVARSVVFFAQAEWKWVVGTTLAVIGLLIAYLNLP